MKTCYSRVIANAPLAGTWTRAQSRARPPAYVPGLCPGPILTLVMSQITYLQYAQSIYFSEGEVDTYECVVAKALHKALWAILARKHAHTRGFKNHNKKFIIQLKFIYIARFTC